MLLTQALRSVGGSLKKPLSLVWMSQLLIKPCVCVCVCVCVRVSVTHIANVLLLELVAVLIYHVLVIEADVSTAKIGQVL